MIKLKQLFNISGEETGTEKSDVLGIRSTAVRVTKIGLSILLGYTLLKGTLAMLPGLFIVAVGYLLIWKLAK